MDLNMRKEYRPFLILKHLKYIKKFNQRVILWQRPGSCVERIIINAKIQRVNEVQRSLEFFPKSKKILKGGLGHLFFFSPWRKLIFKGSMLFNSNFKVVMDVPKSVMMEESRKGARRPTTKFLPFSKYRGGSGEVIQYEKPLIDIGREGLAFRIAGKEVMVFEVEDLLYFSHETDLLGKIRYIAPFDDPKYSKGEFYRVGVEFV